MTDETIAQPGDGGAVPSVEPAVVPKSDAEAAAQEAPKAEAAPTEPPKEDAVEQERKRNRTKAYIDRINRENAELRRQVLERQSVQPPAGSQPTKTVDPDAPTLAGCDYDLEDYTAKKAAYEVKQYLAKQAQEAQSKAQQTQQQETISRYQERLEDFAAAHEDFHEVVGSIAYPLPDELQAAVMAHERGPEIAYHLGLNDDDAFALASIQPHLAAAAVERLAKRLTAAPAPAPVAAPTPTPKPITQAPAPPPSLSGKAPVNVPPEKLTDEQWLAREKERARKR